ncbi:MULTISPECIES: NAD(P)/FAD-dependent oxidoreductase [Halocynthiibacter]|uniref:NAD(P)/FAD-dependent oxidoreductase n=1 Tax=Halocynthiibacter halioticoli TaxID=2986804 RepID=A0AAE3J3H7_9RHOB|nr:MULTISPECIES: FAD/NAD(P)-binding oxidoreductase [Halocynthiibacter]MCV6825886.1 NAD(P)/FAD-dependent oxidoreductase [Halocynthiibacter halioticoli]MCW4058887.1 NAD(P)/FAD-dependent oxidoreductase [Halocynthiibacter sp. SDUM655004]
MAHFVVIGAGQAGASLVAELRNSGFEGEITLIGEEPVPPYQRPPLSKGYMLGELSQERLFLRPESFYHDQNIRLVLGESVSAIDPQSKIVTVGDEAISYDKLAITTGATPRQLPPSIGGNLQNVFTVRSLADADAMSEFFQPGKRLLVVGGGYIGLEAAAVARKKGVDVTLVEMADRILGRVAAPETADYFRALHTDHGVEIREGLGLKALLGDDVVSGAEFSDGTRQEFDFVIVGIGIEPNTAIAALAGLEIENGIRTDSFGQTSDPMIWAAGDCASFPHLGGRIRLESVPNAIDQAETVARNMLGKNEQYVPKVWFWSDQYDIKLQIAGLNVGYDQVVVRPGSTPNAVSHWYFCGNKLLAVDAMNEPRAYMIGKRLIEAGKSAPVETIQNPDSNLKALLK